MYGKLDSVLVQEKKTSKMKDANVGARLSTIEIATLNANKTKSLAELLADNSVIYIKSLGQGALATASFRGTAPAHTRVNWNGININPPMSSTFDFSQIPVFFIDNAELSYGGGQLKNGTGGLGGSINLNNLPNWQKTRQISVFTEYGSYSTYTVGASARFSSNKSQYQTRVYFQQSDNDYTYINKVLMKNPFREKRKEAKYKQVGLMQEAYFNLSPYTTLSSNVWLQFGDHQLPQPIMVNINQHERQKELALKGYMGVDYTKRAHKLYIKGAYLLNTLRYKSQHDNYQVADKKNTNHTNTYHFSTDYYYDACPGLILNTSLSYTHDRIKSEAYQSQTDTSNLRTRNILTWQGNDRWNATSWLLLNGQYMAELNDNRFVSTYSIGFLAQIAPTLHFKGSMAYNYHFPNMNDLYWEPGGNPDLKPEKGYSYDILFSYTPSIGKYFSLKTEISAYLINLDDWILWLPSSEGRFYWSPQNKQNVRSYGSELYVKGEYTRKKFSGNIAINYSYSPAINRERAFAEDASYHCQLPYIPKHKGNVRFALDYNKKWSFTYQVTYTGLRYTTADESYHTNDYTLHNTSLSYHLLIGKRYEATAQLQVDNLFDAYYESTQYYPMPLRNFRASILFTF